MRFIDAKKLDQVNEVETDVCIFGSGVAGITIASELVGQSKNVCLVESGKFVPDEAVQSLYDIENTGYPLRENFMHRARYYGGTSNIWPGRCMVLDEVDLTKRSWVANSGWPIDYAELCRYYQKASELLRLPSFEKFDPAYWKHQMSDNEKSISQNQSLDFNVALWAKKPLRFGKTFFLKLKRSPNVTVYLNLNLNEIHLTENGAAIEKITTRCLNGKSITIKSQEYILACGGLENARLLLASNKQHPNGVGNVYDTVGRYFMDHPRTVFGRVSLNTESEMTQLIGKRISDGKMQMGIRFSEKQQKQEGLLNNYLSLETAYSPFTQKAYSSFVVSMKRILRKGYAGKRFDFINSKLDHIPDLIYLLAPSEIIPHFVYRLYSPFKKKRVKDLIVVNYCEQEPDPESRVVLSQKKDSLGMNTLELKWKIGRKERHSIERLQELLDAHLREAGLGRFEEKISAADDYQFIDASHHMGTTRMSDDPKKGVVDKHCRVHGINNLFIAGSSVFPTAGYANPTLTIVALAIRLADYLGNHSNKSIKFYGSQ